MGCYFDQPLSEDDISDILDGIADESRLEHIKQCDACRERVEAAHQTETFLERYLTRRDCPTPLQLGNYSTGYLDGSEREQIREHIITCSFCQQELAKLEDFLKLDDDAIPVRSSSVDPDNILYLGQDYFQTRAEMHADLRQARGSSKKQLRAHAEGITILIDLQRTQEGLALECMFIPEDIRQLADWVGSLVEIRAADELITVSYVEEDGSFRCDTMPSKILSMRITSLTGIAIMISDIDIRD